MVKVMGHVEIVQTDAICIVLNAHLDAMDSEMLEMLLNLLEVHSL